MRDRQGSRVQKQGHLQTLQKHAHMTSPRPLRTDGSTTRRAMVWSIVALVVIAGIVLYFRYGSDTVPLIGQVR